MIPVEYCVALSQDLIRLSFLEVKEKVEQYYRVFLLIISRVLKLRKLF